MGRARKKYWNIAIRKSEWRREDLSVIWVETNRRHYKWDCVSIVKIKAVIELAV